MLRLTVLLLALLVCPGCCELFGVCTSASIHTSIQSQNDYAQQATPAQELANNQQARGQRHERSY